MKIHAASKRMQMCRPTLLKLSILSWLATTISSYSLRIDPQSHLFPRKHKPLFLQDSRAERFPGDFLQTSSTSTWADLPLVHNFPLNSNLEHSSHEMQPFNAGKSEQQYADGVYSPISIVATRERTNFWQSLGSKTRAKIQKLGLFSAVAYYIISQINSATTMSIAWYMFSSSTGLSPLAAGQWKGYLALYARFMVANAVLRPLRLGMAIACGSKVEQLTLLLQNHVPCKNKTKSTVMTAIVLYSIALLYTAGCFLAASALSGVPLFPTSVDM